MEKKLEEIIKENYSFSSWWKENKKLYENSNVPKAIAKTIWSAALNNFYSALEVAAYEVN